jgi:hypothetical protein
MCFRRHFVSLYSWVWPFLACCVLLTCFSFNCCLPIFRSSVGMYVNIFFGIHLSCIRKIWCFHWVLDNIILLCRACTKNDSISKVIKQFISYPTQAQHTLSAARTVHVSDAQPAVRFSCLLRGRGTIFQDGVTAGEGFLCAPFWGVQICDYSAAWVSCTVQLRDCKLHKVLYYI